MHLIVWSMTLSLCAIAILSRMTLELMVNSLLFSKHLASAALSKPASISSRHILLAARAVVAFRTLAVVLAVAVKAHATVLARRRLALVRSVARVALLVFIDRAVTAEPAVRVVDGRDQRSNVEVGAEVPELSVLPHLIRANDRREDSRAVREEGREGPSTVEGADFWDGGAGAGRFSAADAGDGCDTISEERYRAGALAEEGGHACREEICTIGNLAHVAAVAVTGDAAACG